MPTEEQLERAQDPTPLVASQRALGPLDSIATALQVDPDTPDFEMKIAPSHPSHNGADYRFYALGTDPDPGPDDHSSFLVMPGEEPCLPYIDRACYFADPAAGKVGGCTEWSEPTCLRFVPEPHGGLALVACIGLLILLGALTRRIR